MATELVQRLRESPRCDICNEAADRIERLERLDERILQAAESFAKRLMVLETALDYYADEDRFGHQGDVARRALGWRHE